MKMIVTVKDFGAFEVELWPELAPIACAKVKKIAEMGRYNEHRVERLEPGFVFQPLFFDGTDPVMDEEIELEAKTVPANGAVVFKRGIVAMAGAENFASASQYFVTLQPKDRLNGNFTVIGTVIAGWDTLERIEAEPVTEKKDPVNGWTYHCPKKDIVVESVVIE